MIKSESYWLHCPTCRNKTRVKIRIDTELKNFPLFCPKCKQESLINVKKQQIIVIEPDAEPIIPRMNEISWVIGLFYFRAKRGGLFVLHFLRLDNSVSDTFHDN